MAKKDYIPRKLGELYVWLNNYRAKLDEHKGTLGLSGAEFTAQITFIDALKAAIDNNEQKQADAQQAQAELLNQQTVSITAIRKQAQNLKTRPAYTPGIGEDLGIVGDEQTVDINNAQPKLKARKLENGYELSFGLQGFFDGVKIYRQRPGEAKQFIAIDTSSPYVDAEPMVNGTQYTAWFLIGDNTVGKESDPVIISI